MVKPSPIRFLCVCDRVQRDRGTIDEHSHFDVETGKQKDYWKPLYTSTTIRKAWEEFANKLQKASESPSDYYSTKTLQGFAKTAHRRAKEFE